MKANRKFVFVAILIFFHFLDGEFGVPQVEELFNRLDSALGVVEFGCSFERLNIYRHHLFLLKLYT